MLTLSGKQIPVKHIAVTKNQHETCLPFHKKVVTSCPKGTCIQLQKVMESDPMNISEWLKANKLSLNIKKTHFMVCTSKNKTPTNMAFHIGGQQIEKVEHTTF